MNNGGQCSRAEMMREEVETMNGDYLGQPILFSVSQAIVKIRAGSFGFCKAHL